MSKTPRLPKEILNALDASKRSWEITDGGRHFKILVGGKLAGIYPKGKISTADRRVVLNTAAQIRRIARG